MRKFIFPTLLLCGVLLSGTAYALPYVGADIELAGDQYSDISNLGTIPVSGGNEWYKEDGTIWTAWSGQWVEYSADLTTGTWNVGLNVTNHGTLAEGWYASFEVRGTTTESDQLFYIQADDLEINNGFFTKEICLDTDNYTVRYTWLNDQYAPPLDANIQVVSAFFDDVSTPPAPVPEPATMLLLGTGLIGIAGISRKKMFRK